jgi:hypothetical protein
MPFKFLENSNSNKGILNFLYSNSPTRKKNVLEKQVPPRKKNNTCDDHE